MPIIVRRTLDHTSPPPKIREETAARLNAMSPEDIERNAREDRDNPPLTEAELAHVSAARAVRATRESVGLSQGKFAETYRINPARLRDWEQGRSSPDSVALAYMEVIRKQPVAVGKALGFNVKRGDDARAAPDKWKKPAENYDADYFARKHGVTVEQVHRLTERASDDLARAKRAPVRRKKA